MLEGGGSRLKYPETFSQPYSTRRQMAGRVRASFDALFFRSEQGRWVNLNSGDTRSCKVQLLQNEAGYALNCRQDGQVKLA